MKVSIMDVDYGTIFYEIKRQNSNGSKPRYCIMNKDTYELFNAKSSIAKVFGNGEDYGEIYDLTIAISPRLEFGVVDIV